jgi:HlyD family secretion protein
MMRLACALLLLTAPAWADTAPTTGPKPPSVTVARASRGTLVDTVILNGTLVAREEVLVNAQVDGLPIIEILAEEGDIVRQGQVLARLSREQLDTNLAQNAAQLARANAAIAQQRSAIVEAEANDTQAAAAFERTRELVKSGAASRETFDQRQAGTRGATARLRLAESALLVAEADLNLAQAQQKELLVRLARTEIRSPVDGRVSRRVARQGAVVAMAGDPLFRVIEGGAVELDADVPETLLARLRVGQPAVVSAGGDHPARVRLVSPEINRASRLGRVRIAVDDNEGLVIGAFASARVELARRDGLRVPLSAVLFQPDGPRVQVVTDSLVQTRPVTVGLRAGKLVEIIDGLREGETVISVSGTFVRQGDRVTPVAGS